LRKILADCTANFSRIYLKFTNFLCIFLWVYQGKFIIIFLNMPCKFSSFKAHYMAGNYLLFFWQPRDSIQTQPDKVWTPDAQIPSLTPWQCATATTSDCGAVPCYKNGMSKDSSWRNFKSQLFIISWILLYVGIQDPIGVVFKTLFLSQITVKLMSVKDQ